MGKDVKFKNNASHLVILSIIVMYFINIPCHSMLVFTAPCLQTFLSSVILNCRSPAEKVDWQYILPFFIFELGLFSYMLMVMAFNWTFAYLGLARCKQILNGDTW